jgi:hypothetical protein
MRLWALVGVAAMLLALSLRRCPAHSNPGRTWIVTAPSACGSSRSTRPRNSRVDHNGLINSG